MESFHHLKCFLPHKEGSRLPIRQPFKEPNTNSNSAPLKTSAPKSRPTNLPAIVIETIPEEKENSKGDLTINLESTEPPCSLTREQEDLASCGDCKPLDETTIVLDSENLKETTVKALHELLTLIHTGYPWESCKEWLTALRSRNPDAESLPDFWECLAALEEKQGDMQMAVDSYQRALMRGAQVIPHFTLHFLLCTL
ncbi:cytoskeleton-associated protein 2-like isoform X1 [Nilaparvata lugens]|uniref:cytoskeleton-associated protein 2-like isoform X1 n=1 Tax=Nilaparvata lugens TaxID=108931 RepID=UPI00193E4176|nr:cytoskeleton-associated protein 2-like isoform X1 [Nilaparvata lugens]